jgi:signal transduction histidine kinase
MPNNAVATIELAEPSLSEALRALSPHAAEIRTTWRKLLTRRHGCGKYAAFLAKLEMAPENCSASLLRPEACNESFERQGDDLARNGVPAECSALAVALYVEACIPYLVSDAVLNDQRINALLNWASQCQYFLLAGYARQASAVSKSHEEKVAQAERRTHEFSASLAEAYEKERRRLARDLHDEIGHDLIVLKLYIEVLTLDLKKGDTDRVSRKLKESISLIKHALKAVRSLTFDLGPTVWNEQGFIAAIKLYTRQFARRTGMKVRLDISRLRTDLPQSCETALYKVLQGALANVVAHAQAQRVGITVWTTRDSVRMKIADDGKGYNVDGKAQSYGLSAMRERIELLGGTIHFASTPIKAGLASHGSTIELNLPLKDPQARARELVVDTALLLSFISRQQGPAIT